MKHSGLPERRKDAREAGSKYYCTNKPCPHGHMDKRLTSTGQCIGCETTRKKSRINGVWQSIPNTLPFDEKGLLEAVKGKPEGVQRIRAMIKYYEGCKLDTRDKYVKSYLDEVIDGLVGRIFEVQRKQNNSRIDSNNSSKRSPLERISQGS